MSLTGISSRGLNAEALRLHFIISMLVFAVMFEVYHLAS